ncbi:MAG TPA: GntR family transcriptional regulator [Clostridia bacterium]|nr:GntR family transcriptional regulator [Clostridia bacterium]
MSSLKSNKNISQSERAYNSIKKSILNLDLKPGQQLSESDLATQLKMSRTPIREAISKLNNENLVDVIPRKGTFVKILSGNEIKNIYETAEGLESMAVYLVVKRKDEIDLDELSEQVKNMEIAFENNDIEKWIKSDELFHSIMRKFCDNEYIIEDLKKIDTQIHRVRIMMRKILTNRKKSTKEHRETFEKIVKGDAKGARETMHKHWERVRKDILRIYPFG